MISSIGREGQDLARELLRFDPAQRPSAKKVSFCLYAGTWRLNVRQKALLHSFFTSYPPPTPPIALPKPLAELRPRELAPDEVQGKPLLTSGAGQGLKRKAESPRTSHSVSRKLIFT